MTDCYICQERIEEDDWVIPLPTHRATYFGDDDEISLAADDTMETIIHPECLPDSSQNGSDSS